MLACIYSGKSSLLLCLLGLLDLRSGSIFVDDVDLSTIPEHIMRSHVIAIPQIPSIFPGSVRFNLTANSDDSSLHNKRASAAPCPVSDEAKILALSKVSLWNTVNDHGGLDADMMDIPLSAGQRQLFCLARAIVQKMQIEVAHDPKAHGGIIILDEANSNMDMATADLIQRLLKDEFTQSSWTALVVTHRLRSAVAADTIVLLDAGRVIEFGRSDVLMQAEQSSVRRFFYGQN